MKVRGDLEMISKRGPYLHQTLSPENPKRLWNWSVASTWKVLAGCLLPSGYKEQKRKRGENGSTTAGLGSSQG